MIVIFSLILRESFTDKDRLNMPKVVAFLRAINVGGHTVKMDGLRALFVSIGFEHVETFIASGNVIFKTTHADLQALERLIEDHLKKALGYPVATFIRTLDEVSIIAAYEPFSQEDMHTTANRIYVAFLPDQPGKTAGLKLQPFISEYDEFHIHQREVYWLCRKNMSDSDFSGALLEKTLGMLTTLRNLNTIKRIAAKSH
jgi:uncharacterized protein (DUF1697 family)